MLERSVIKTPLGGTKWNGECVCVCGGGGGGGGGGAGEGEREAARSCTA